MPVPDGMTIDDLLPPQRRPVGEERYRAHDELEKKIMDIVRPFTDRKHLPDRWVSFSGVICPYDVKTTNSCEDNSHDEYQRLVREGYCGMWVAYQKDSEIFADWFTDLEWEGPLPPSPRSRNGDPYYRVHGGRPLKQFLACANKEIRLRKNQ